MTQDCASKNCEIMEKQKIGKGLTEHGSWITVDHCLV